jgi:RNA recognition motif-containing protein
MDIEEAQVNAAIKKRLGNAESEQNFIDEMAQILAPYGQVKRTQLLVEKGYPKSEVSCFVEMATPQQAVAAQNGLSMLLLGNCYLFFSVKLMGEFIE